MPSELEDAIERHRQALLRRERAAASQMVRAYGDAWQRLRRDIMRADANAVWRASTETERERYLYQHWQAIRPQIASELRRFAAFATESVVQSQRAAISAALADSEEAIALTAPNIRSGFGRINRAAVENIIGAASDGSPLRALFDGIGSGIADDMASTLARGVALGWGPRFTARELRASFGLGLTRALVIARTETLRAYNEATHRNYLNHSDVITGWVWFASLNARTCASCWAMHGSIHPLSERIDDHPCGRCTKVPIVSERANNYGRTGPEVFATLTEQEQRGILGNGMYEAWRDGAVTMTPAGQRSIVGRRNDPQWGTMRYARSLRSIVGAEEAQRYIALADARRREPNGQR